MKPKYALIVIGMVACALLLTPAPEGLAPHAWHFFAIFVATALALVFEPLPGAAICLISVTGISVFSDFFLFSAEKLALPTAERASAALSWALSGFANSTVWLIFGAFMFALGYEKTGLGRRLALHLVRALGKHPLSLGYAIVASDLLLAPFTPSNTARSGGIIYPIISNLPPLYGSYRDDAKTQGMGSYLMWVAIATTCVTSSMFLTALAPNLLALELINKQTQISVGWVQWCVAFAPVGLILLLLIPLLSYQWCRPTVKCGDVVLRWAGEELQKLGKFTRQEYLLSLFIFMALILWVFASDKVHPATVSLFIICLMLVCRTLRWDDILSNKAAWNTLVWFATLVALADGLNHTGFIAWFASMISHHLEGWSASSAVLILCTLFYLSHYLFASVTAHVTAMLPIILAVGQHLPGLHLPTLALALLGSLGFMGILTPYGTGPSPVYYGSGYLPAVTYWRLGAVFGFFFLLAYLLCVTFWLPSLLQSK